MAAEDCIRFIRNAAPDLNDDEITDIIEDLQERLDRRKRNGELISVEEALLDEADMLARDAVEAAHIERRNRLLNLKAKAELLDIAQRADEAVGDPSLGLEAAMVGVNAPFAGGRRSVDANANAMFTKYAGGLIADLKKENLLVDYNSGALDLKIAKELEQITFPNPERGITGSRKAQKIAEIIHKYRDVALSRKNRAGAWVKPLPGYVVRQTHDVARISRASRRLGGPATSDFETNFQAWRNFTAPLLDEKTFKSDPDEFLRRVFENLRSGVHLRHSEGQNDLRLAFKGPGNLAKRESAHRVLHFRDAEAWMEYNKMFGSRSLREAVMQDLEQSARATALMERFGTNPRALFDEVREDLIAKYKNDDKKLKRLRRSVADTLEWHFRKIDGTTSIPGNPSFARNAASVRALQTLSKLGGAFLSSIADVPAQATEVRHQRGQLLKSWGQAFQNVFDGLSTNEDKRRFADLLGVGLDSSIGDIAARHSAQDDLPGTLSRAQQVFFKVNLLGPWTDANKRGIGMMMARDLALDKGKSWAQLADRRRTLLAQYGLDAEKWEIARQSVRKGADGREYLMPEGVQDIDVPGREGRRIKDDVETALRAYYVDRAEFASPTPGGRENSYLTLGTQPGTALGEAVRFMMQFKAFPVTVNSRVLGREIFGQGHITAEGKFVAGQADFIGLANIIIGTTVMGYLAQTAKEAAKGRSPRDPENPQTWVAATLQGGGLGIYGDFLLGETNRFGRSLLDTFAGPTIGTIADVDELRARAMAGEKVDTSVFRLIQGNTPFLNLFYTRAALDYLIFYQIQESLNPGYLRRMERRIKKENNQTFIIPPTSTIPRGGGSRPLEGVR